jgi:hypothetical protein
MFASVDLSFDIRQEEKLNLLFIKEQFWMLEAEQGGL